MPEFLVTYWLCDFSKIFNNSSAVLFFFCKIEILDLIPKLAKANKQTQQTKSIPQAHKGTMWSLLWCFSLWSILFVKRWKEKPKNMNKSICWGKTGPFGFFGTRPSDDVLSTLCFSFLSTLWWREVRQSRHSRWRSRFIFQRDQCGAVVGEGLRHVSGSSPTKSEK